MSNATSQFRILVVEDEPSLRTSMVDLLAFYGYAVDGAKNGNVALRCVEQHLPDLIISDVMMPEMDGHQLVKHLRSVPATTKTPIILVSGQITATSVDEGLTLGANKFIKKPFVLDEFVQIVAQMLPSSNDRRVG